MTSPTGYYQSDLVRLVSPALQVTPASLADLRRELRRNVPEGILTHARANGIGEGVVLLVRDCANQPYVVWRYGLSGTGNYFFFSGGYYADPRDAYADYETRA